MPKHNHKITETVIKYDTVKIVLEGGVFVNISSNPGYIHISIGGSGRDTEPIEFKQTAANCAEIRYPSSKE